MRKNSQKTLWYLLAIVVICSLCGCGIVALSVPRHFTLATWNIGNFSNGAQGYSTIDIAKDPNIGQKYRDFINKTIKPDVLVINEYTYVFYKDKDGKKVYTDSVLFGSFGYRFIGPDCWKCNAIFSKHKILNLGQDDESVIYFTAHKAIKDDVGVSKRNTYYLENIVEIRGKRIKIVSVHIDFSKTVSGVYQKAQIGELIEKYKDEPRVIICGDFNVGGYAQFTNAGYTVANDGSFKTFPSKNYPLDNIIVKGVSISDVRMYPTTLSDHNPIVCTITF